MTPLEAYRIISGCMHELVGFRQLAYPRTQGWNHDEITAQVIMFEALRQMQEGEVMKEICKNCEHCSPTYKGYYCEIKRKKTKSQGSCDHWGQKK